uniref:Glycosyl transferase family 1 domain-containing protein n=1 Tax=Proboscia inermis TaxID=420281 RepID=A0A7S0GA45_9STRA
MEAFWKAFVLPANDTDTHNSACLVIVTSTYHDDPSRIHSDLQKLWLATIPPHSTNRRKKIVFLSGLATHDLIQLYNIADAFVLPSRGEGWGRPYIEAMAMGLPVIATNWSGPTEFVTPENGYLLPLNSLEPLVDAKLEAFPGHRWANPDGDKLVELLRRLCENPEAGRLKGRVGRRDVETKWSHLVVAKLIRNELERVVAVSSDVDEDSVRNEL